MKDVRPSAGKNCRCDEGTMGQKKGKESTCLDYKKERRNYRGGKEKAFTVDEGAVGGKKERPKEVIPGSRSSVSRRLYRLDDM
jgi:hypothetical protein